MTESPRNDLARRVRDCEASTFEALALDIFHYQSRYNPIYAQFLELLQCEVASVRRIADIPFLPISLFKDHQLQSGNWKATRIFTSSGTTGSTPSQHLLRDDQWYQENARRAFQRLYGPLSNYTVFALLPAYLERKGSSLVFMADDFIRSSGCENSGFYLDKLGELVSRINLAREKGGKILVLGVSFALLDLAEGYPQSWGEEVVVMETGGMKGRRRELTREELHETIKVGLGVKRVHSEYGMTELLSQAYAPQNGLFRPAPTMRVLTRDVTDPLSIRFDNRTGAINVIDLANLDTISFIATDDLGRVYPDGDFEVLGRMDASDTRGCNLLVE